MRAALTVSMIALAVSLWAAPASGETLPQAMTAALQTNPALASQRAQLDAVRQALPLAWAEALPQITLNGSAVHQGRSEPSFAFTVREQPEYWIGSVNSSLLLFGSGRVWSSTRQARAQIASAIARYQSTAQNLLLEVTRAYGGVTLARSVKEAQERSLENLREQLRYVQANVDRGFLTQTDLAQARARMEQARSGLAQADVQLVQATETFMRLVGHPPGELEPADDLTGLPAELDAALEIAGRENPQIVAGAADVRASDAAVGVANAAGRPRITLEATDSVFEPIDRPNSRRQSEDTLSIRASVPLFAGGSIFARSRQQHHLSRAARFDLDDVQRQVHEDVSVAWANVFASRTSVTASQSRVEAAELAQRGTVREQQAGLRTTIDVLNQEQELLSARVDLARAERDALVAERELAAAMGRLMALSLPDGPVLDTDGPPSRPPPIRRRGRRHPSS